MDGAIGEGKGTGESAPGSPEAMMSSGMTSLLSLQSVCYNNQQLRAEVPNHFQEKESSEKFSCLCEVTLL